MNSNKENKPMPPTLDKADVSSSLDCQPNYNVIAEPKYFLGVDTYDKDCLSYCLMRKIGECNEVILAKQMNKHNEAYFDEEVNNIAKYFNATTIWNGD